MIEITIQGQKYSLKPPGNEDEGVLEGISLLFNKHVLEIEKNFPQLPTEKILILLGLELAMKVYKLESDFEKHGRKIDELLEICDGL